MTSNQQFADSNQQSRNTLNRSQNMDEQEDNAQNENNNQNQNQQLQAPVVAPVEVEFSSAIRDIRTYLLAFAVGFSLVQGTYVSLVFKNYGGEFITNDKFITIVGTIGAVMNGVSRGFWGVLVDKIQFFYAYSVIFSLQIAMAFTMELAVRNKGLFFIWVATSYFCLGGHFSMTPAV